MKVLVQQRALPEALLFRHTFLPGSTCPFDEETSPVKMLQIMCIQTFPTNLVQVHEDAAQWLQAIWAEKELQLESWEATESFDAKELKLTLPLRPVLFPSLCYGAALTLISVVIISGARALTGGGGGS